MKNFYRGCSLLLALVVLAAFNGSLSERVTYQVNKVEGRNDSDTELLEIKFSTGTELVLEEGAYELRNLWGHDFLAQDFNLLLKKKLEDYKVGQALKTSLFILQFKSQVLEEYRQLLKEEKIQILATIPKQALLVKASQGALDRIQGWPFLHATKVFGKQAKYSAEPLSWVYKRFLAVVASEKQLRSFWSKVEAAQLLTHTNSKKSRFVELSLNPQQWSEMLSWDEIFWLEEAHAPETDVDNARIQAGVDRIEHLARIPFSGRGVNGHVLEGIDPQHSAFGASEFRSRPIAIDDGTSDSHGHQTFGILFGDGTDDPTARGIIPDAQGFYTHNNAVYDSSDTGRGSGTRFELNERLMRDHRVMFQTASWGYPQTTEYTGRSAEMDQLIFDLDMPITQSQSNTGTRRSRPQAWAKNIISIGAVQHHNNPDPSDDFWTGASIGPAADGRIKPDLVAYYDQIKTTALWGGYTPRFGGTSGATPIVAGFMGLSIELFARGIFGNHVVAGDLFASRPHFTTTKALLINSARQYDFEGEDHNLTRVHQGWGFPSLEDMYEARNETLIDNEDSVLRTLETRSYRYHVERGRSELKATLVFADPPAHPSAERQLVNDLDLRVIDPQGQIYRGNVGLRTGTHSRLGGQADSIDTVENVFIHNPQAGTWTIEVFAREVNQDAHVETQALDADYALIVRRM